MELFNHAFIEILVAKLVIQITYFKNKKVQKSLDTYEEAKKILLMKFNNEDAIVRRVNYNLEKVKYAFHIQEVIEMVDVDKSIVI